IPLYGFREGTVLFRYHSGSTWLSGQTLYAILRVECYTDQDPNTDFILPSGGDLASVSISGVTVPTLGIAAAQFGGSPGGFGPYFVDTSSVFSVTTSLAHTYFDSSGAAGKAWMVGLSGNFGHRARFQLSMSQPTTPVSATAVVSVDLVLKTDG